jgi:hypothetical protein
MPHWVREMIAAVSLVAAATTTFAQVQDASIGYSLNLAPGWSAISDEAFAPLKALQGSGLEFIGVYSPSAAWKPGEAAMILQFQKLKTEAFTREGLAEALMGEASKVKGSTIAASFEQVLTGAGANVAYFDSTQDRYAIASTPREGSRVLVVGYFCSQGIVQMTFEAPAASYAALQPQIAAIAGGVKIAPEKAFKAKPSPDAAKSDNTGFRIVIAITIAAVGFGIAKSSLKKKRVASKV